MPINARSVAEGALAGAIAGAFASFAMNQFQSAVSRLQSSSDGGGGGDPATVKAAEWVVGHSIDKSEKGRAEGTVHYGFGAALGAVYGAAVELEPWMATGFGMPFGGVVAVVADEALVPAAGLSDPPEDVPVATHLYSIVSHLVFGAALEAARRVLLRAF
jgi:hypothetical protein